MRVNHFTGLKPYSDTGSVPAVSRRMQGNAPVRVTAPSHLNSLRHLVHWLNPFQVSPVAAPTQKRLNLIFTGRPPEDTAIGVMAARSSSVMNERERISWLLAPMGRFGSLVTYRSNELDSNVHYAVGPSSAIDESGRHFEEIPRNSPAIVLWFHGSGGRSAGTNFFAEMSQLANYNIGCASIDLPEHAGGPKGSDYTPAEFADWVHAWVSYYREKYPDKKIILAGHSNGPTCIRTYLKYHPQGADGIIPLSPGGWFDEVGCEHYTERYSKALSEVLANPTNELPFDRDASTWANRLQLGQSLDGNIFFSDSLPVSVFAGSDDVLYPSGTYLSGLAQGCQREGARLAIGQGYGHFIFEIGRDTDELRRHRVYVDTFGERAELYEKTEGLRFISALVLNHLHYHFGIGIDPKQKLERDVQFLYLNNPSFQEMVDRYVVNNKLKREISANIMRKEKARIQAHILNALAAHDGVHDRVFSILVGYFNIWTKRSPNKRKHDIGCAVAELEDIITIGLADESDSDSLHRLCHEVLAAVGPADMVNVNEFVADIATALADKKTTKDRVFRAEIEERVTREAETEIDTGGVQINELAAKIRAEILDRSESLFAAWRTVCAAIVLFEMHPLFRELSGISDIAELKDPVRAQKAVSDWSDTVDSLKRDIIGSIPEVYPEFFENPGKFDPRLSERTTEEGLMAEAEPISHERSPSISRSDIEMVIDVIHQERDPHSVFNKSREFARLRNMIENKTGRILSALNNYLKHMETHDRQTFEWSYTRAKDDGLGGRVSNEWKHHHARKAQNALWMYNNAIAAQKWQIAQRQQLESGSPWSSLAEMMKYAEVQEVLRARQKSIIDLRDTVAFQSKRVLAVGTDGDVLLPFGLFEGTDHVVALSSHGFGLMDIDRAFSAGQLAAAHRHMAYGDAFFKAFPDENKYGAGRSYLDNLIMGLVKDQNPVNFLHVFYFRIENGKKVYVQRRTVSDVEAHDLNVEVAFIDEEGQEKKLDVISCAKDHIPPSTETYLHDLGFDAVFVGNGGTRLENDPAVFAPLKRLAEGAGAPLFATERPEILFRMGRRTISWSDPFSFIPGPADPNVERYVAGNTQIYRVSPSHLRDDWDAELTHDSLQAGINFMSSGVMTSDVL